MLLFWERFREWCSTLLTGSCSRVNDLVAVIMPLQSPTESPNAIDPETGNAKVPALPALDLGKGAVTSLKPKRAAVDGSCSDEVCH